MLNPVILVHGRFFVKSNFMSRSDQNKANQQLDHAPEQGNGPKGPDDVQSSPSQ